MTQLNYSRTIPRGRAGARADGTLFESIGRLYAMLAQITTVGVGGTTDGTYTVRITDSLGNAFDSSFVAVSQTADQIVAGIAAAINDNEDLNNLVSAVGSAALDEVAITGVHEGDSFTVSFPSNPGTNLTQVATQSSTVANLPVAIAVCPVAGSEEDNIRVPAAGDFSDDVLGLVMQSPNEDPANNDGTSAGYAAGRTVSVMVRGSAWVEPEDAVTANGRVHVRKVAAGAEQVGALRGTGDGTAQVVTATPTASQNATQFLVQITILTGPNAGENYVLDYTSDASMTATEVCDGLRADLNANSRLAALITDSGTATLILTAADPETTFEVESIGVGLFDSITETTAPVIDTILMPPNWRFDTSAAAGAPAKLVIK